MFSTILQEAALKILKIFQNTYFYEHFGAIGSESPKLEQK